MDTPAYETRGDENPRRGGHSRRRLPGHSRSSERPASQGARDDSRARIPRPRKNADDRLPDQAAQFARAARATADARREHRRRAARTVRHRARGARASARQRHHLMFGRFHFALLGTAGFLGLAPCAAVAQDYPAKAIHWIVPYPPGGTSDFVARLMGQKLTEAWKQPVVIDNRGGANGNIGTEMAARAPSDGYTLLLVANSLAINQSVYTNL